MIDLTDDLTAAESRVRREKAGAHPFVVYGVDDAKAQGWYDRKLLTDAYLAERDPTPLDGPALIAAGFCDDGSDGYEVTLADGSHLELWADDAGEYAVTLTAHPELTRHADDVSGEIRLPAVRTRGQLAVLCRGLGIAGDPAECTAIGPHHGDRCSGGRIQSPNAQFTRDCPVCRGLGITSKGTT